MKRKPKLILIATTGFFVTLLLFLSNPSFTNADDNPVDIRTSPDSVLFDVNNMKPGDWAERELTIQNRGEANFTYHMEVDRKNGSEKLFEALTLEVNTDAGIIFEGKLSEFTGFEPRFLETLHEELLTLKVGFPPELGNEYQGLEVEVEFQFVAEQEDAEEEEEQPEDPEDPEDSKDPEQPEEPEDPEQPKEPEEETNEPEEDQEEQPVSGGGSTQKPIDKDVLDQEPKENHILPSTATNSFNFLAIGLVIVLTGVGILVINNRRKKRFSE